jgi:thiol:disulfide interchange protein DsbA
LASNVPSGTNEAASLAFLLLDEGSCTDVLTSQVLGITEQTHTKIFDALVPQRRTVRSEQQAVDLFVEFGVDRIEAEKASNSFAVRTKTNQAEKLTRDYKPTGTPSMVVNGEYLVSLAGPVNTTQEVLRVVDFLAEKEGN